MKKRSDFLSDVLLQNLSKEDLYFECLRFGLPVSINDDRYALEIYFRAALVHDILNSPIDANIVELTKIKLSRFRKIKILAKNLTIKLGIIKIN